MIAFIKTLFGMGGEQVDVHEAVRRINAGAVLVDVRGTQEFTHGHAPQALHLPVTDIQGDHASLCRTLKLAPETREVLLICASGMRSRLAQNRLSGNSACRYVNVSGGMAAWAAAGLPVKRRN